MPEKIRNIGPKSYEWLNKVGIYTLDDICKRGAVKVYKKIINAGYKPNLNLLYSLEAAILNINWKDLPDELKQELKSELNK